MSGEYTRTRGERMGPYVLAAPLGRGGFSEVWSAWNDANQNVALKLLIHPEHMSQLRAEAKALALVRGEGVVKILALDLDHEPPYIALELLEGGNLRTWIKNAGGALTPVIALKVFEQILRVLEHVHHEGIVHGDLKPENVLFPFEGGPLKLADFGLSRRITQRTATLSVSLSLDDARLAGTLDYMAPEQRSGEKPSPRSDIYAAGVILYELLVGERPQGVFAMPSERNGLIPPILDRIIACSLAQDPRHRFASAGAVLEFLRSELKTDWKDLAAAHQRIDGLLNLGNAAQVSNKSTLIAGLVLVLGPLFFAAVAAGAWQVPEGPVRLLGAVVISVGLVILTSQLTAPWLFRRRAALMKLKHKIELQIQSEKSWEQFEEKKNKPWPRRTRRSDAPRASESEPTPVLTRRAPAAVKKDSIPWGAIAFVVFVLLRILLSSRR